MKIFDVVTVGNCMIDVFMEIQKDNIFSHIDQENRRVCFRFGEKIHVNSCEFQLGGNACNVGVGLSRLGFETGLFAEIGNDEFSQKILNLLSREAIDTSMLIQTKGKGSSFAIGINYVNERTLFVDHIQRAHNFIFDNVETDWIYLTSLGIEWKQAYIHTLQYLEHAARKLAFSPGTHQMEAFDDPDKYQDEIEILDRVLKRTDILFLNKEEGVRIVNSKLQIANSHKEGNNIKELSVILQKMGPKVVSMTDGGKGAYSIDQQGVVRFIEKFPNTAVEKTGAGDAYATGFLGAYMAGQPIDEAMRWGSINAASVVEKTGAQPGLLPKNQIEDKLRQHLEFKAKEV